MTARALVVHTGGGLGDVLLSRPVVDALAEGGYQVDFLARSSTALALQGHPQLHQVLTTAGKDPESPSEMRRWAQRLAESQYRVSLLLWSTSRWAWTLRWAGIPTRVGQDSRLLYSFLFTHRVRVRSEYGDVQSHWTDILLDYPRALGLEPNHVKVEYPVEQPAQQTAASLLRESDFGTLTGPTIGFHCGKGLPLGPERWPVAHFAELAGALQSRLQARLILTGGPQEVALVQALEQRLSLPVLNLAGRTDLPTLAAVAQNCRVFVCPDSGPMHLAAAVGTPVVGIYALDEDFPHRWAPFGVAHRVIRPPRPACPPGCRKPTCPNFSCYLKVAPEDVTQAVVDLLQKTEGQESITRERNGHAL